MVVGCFGGGRIATGPIELSARIMSKLVLSDANRLTPSYRRASQWNICANEYHSRVEVSLQAAGVSAAIHS
jgi:hypothetical protein